MAKELAKQYDPKDVEERIYGKWLEGKYFHAKCEKEKDTFTIVIMVITQPFSQSRI